MINTHALTSIATLCCRILLFGSTMASIAILGACANPPAQATFDQLQKLSVVLEYTTAKRNGEFERAERYLDPDARVWYGTRVGEGRALRLGKGRWSQWDEYFHGKSTPISNWSTLNDEVWRDLSEENDFYRLIERPAGRYRRTYFVSDTGRITGTMVGSIPDAKIAPDAHDRFGEFVAWARVNEPAELDYLLPGGEIDPTEDRAPRMRRLLERWRDDAGLPPIHD